MNNLTKEKVLKAIWSHGTVESAVEFASLEAIYNEMERSSVFKNRIKKALEASKGILIDEARALVRDYMRGKYDRTDRNRLTAAIALLNAYEPGFKGAARIEGRITHDIRVISAVPRPQYKEIPLKTARKEIRDRDGLIAIQEGEVVND